MNDPLEPWYIKTVPGMNNKIDELELGANFVKLAKNCRFEDYPGAVSKRPPLSTYNGTTVGTGGLVGLFRFYSSTGNIKTVCAHDNDIYVGNDSTGVMTAIRTLSNSDKRTSFVIYNDLLIGSNGYDNMWVYDGSDDNLTWELGACKAKAGSGTGITKTNISYCITIDEDAYVTGSVSNTIASVTNKNIDLSYIPLGPIGTTNRKIYRKDSGTSGAYRLVATIADNTTTTYSDNTDDISLGALLPTVTDALPKGNILIMHRERLFISGNPTNQNRIWYSNPYLPHFIQADTNQDYMEIAKDDGDKITALAIQLGTLICFKRNTIRKIYVTSATSGASPEQWYAEDPLIFIGTPAQWSVCQTPYGIMYLSWDGWYKFDGSSNERVIDQFDTDEILDSQYSDTVTHFNKGIFYAAYTDRESATQHHNKVMVFNVKRNALAIDDMNINCFSSHTGDDESGELFLGDSNTGLIYKAEESDYWYRLTSKTQVDLGTKTNVFVGGTQSAPYIEIGATTSAVAIPNDICIFWDNDSATPGSGWTEVAVVDRLIKISTTAGTIAGSGHTHSITGNLAMSTSSLLNGGDGGPGSTANNHEHTINATASGSADAFPRYVKLRVFKKNGTTTEYEFPVGAIVMWDQQDAPEGWMAMADWSGYYPYMDNADLAIPTSDTAHSHSYSIYSNSGGDCLDSGSNDNNAHAACNHTHLCHGDTESKTLETMELSYVGMTFIKRIGETGTWDGSTKYCYALFDAATAASNGWSDVSSTYNGRYLKCLTGYISTADASDNAHDHPTVNGTSDTATQLGSTLGGYQHQFVYQHTHSYTFTVAEATITDVPHRTFRLFRKLIGKMKDYNTAIESTYTAGTYTAPSAQISAETLKYLYFNASTTGSDTVTIHIRTGATQVACEAASWGTGYTESFTAITQTPNQWIQWKIEFTATDTMVSNPRVYFADGFVVKYNYSKAEAYAETAVEFIYETGFRHFDQPMLDKITKRIQSYHDGSNGQLIVYWETENATNSFTISLATYPQRWTSFMHDTCMGKKLNIKLYKNDLYDFKCMEISGVYTSQPMII